MGALDKLKSRIGAPQKSGQSIHGFDTGRNIGSGVSAVNAGLQSGYSQGAVQQANVGAEIAETLAGIGTMIAGKIGEGDRSKSIAKSKKAGKTGTEARSQWKKEKSDDLAARGKKAVDEGRDKKADRLLKRAAKNEDRSIDLEEKAYHQKRKKNGSKKQGDFVSLESEDIAPILRSMPSGTDNEEKKPQEFGARFGNAPIIDEGLI
jgi:hypothetical protein